MKGCVVRLYVISVESCENIDKEIHQQIIRLNKQKFVCSNTLSIESIV